MIAVYCPMCIPTAIKFILIINNDCICDEEYPEELYKNRFKLWKSHNFPS